ncbi:MAG TPA: hypothetical protein VGK74_02785 [Symbiobacteriaceae bacterium]|jgi:N-acetylneuraminic acid mutarotase
MSLLKAYVMAISKWIELVLSYLSPTATFAYPRYQCAGFELNGLIYVAAGLDSVGNRLTSVQAYDPTTGTWTAKADLPIATYGGGSAVVSGKAYYMGGLNSPDGTSSRIYEYDPVANSWTTKATMLTPVANIQNQAFAIGASLYVPSGVASTSTYLATQAYTPGSNTWSTKASVPYGNGYYLRDAATAVYRGIGYFICGLDYNSSVLNAMYAYDPVANSWSTKATALAGDYKLGAVVPDSAMDRILTLGGPSSQHVYEYSALQNRWIDKGASTTRQEYAVAVKDHICYEIGGYWGPGGATYHNTAYRYQASPDSSYTALRDLILTGGY